MLFPLRPGYLHVPINNLNVMHIAPETTPKTYSPVKRGAEGTDPLAGRIL